MFVSSSISSVEYESVSVSVSSSVVGDSVDESVALDVTSESF